MRARMTGAPVGPTIVATLKAKARALGFEACGVTSADPPPEMRQRLAAWLADGAEGDMAWMAAAFARRADPRALMHNAKSLVMLGLNYGPTEDPLAAIARKTCGAISVYARNRDYHDVIKGKLKELAAWLVAAARPKEADVKVFVDTAPLMEKPMAALRRDRMAGQTHEPRVARFRLVAVARRDPHRPRARAGRAGSRSLRNLPRLSRRLPDRRLSGALPARRAALRLLSHDRAQGPDPAGLEAGDRQPDLRL